MPLSTNLREYIAACFRAIWVQSHEHEDALAEMAQLCRDEDLRLATWDVSQGLQIAGQNEEAESTGTDPPSRELRRHEPGRVGTGRKTR